MGISLADFELEAARQALLGPESDRLIALMFALNVGQNAGEFDAEALSIASRLGWIHSFPPRLTRLGFLVSDSIREYRWWIERRRRLHSEGEHAALDREAYRDKAVLEPGSGVGCNLFSLAELPGRFVGVEPVQVYRQLAPIFAEREGLRPPEILAGRCEQLPFASGQFDVVLCYSAHQYMDVRTAIREMARVLRPGGELRVFGGAFGSFVCGATRRFLQRRELGALKHDLLAVANTIGYQWLGRRVAVPRSNGSTAAPVYPGERSMQRWIDGSGLRLRRDLPRRVGVETCYVAEKIALALAGFINQFAELAVML